MLGELFLLKDINESHSQSCDVNACMMIVVCWLFLVSFNLRYIVSIFWWYRLVAVVSQSVCVFAITRMLLKIWQSRAVKIGQTFERCYMPMLLMDKW